jgi:hypothetical protein
MWMQFHVTLLCDGEEPFTNHFCLWFPSIANIGTIHLRLEIRVNLDTQQVTGTLNIRTRQLLEHWDDEEPDVV